MIDSVGTDREAAPDKKERETDKRATRHSHTDKYMQIKTEKKTAACRDII